MPVPKVSSRKLNSRVRRPVRKRETSTFRHRTRALACYAGEEPGRSGSRMTSGERCFMRTKPVVVTIPHQMTRQQVKDRLNDGLGQIRGQLMAFVTSIEDSWNGDRLDFRIVALAQTITGRIDVLDDSVRVEVDLPWMLAMLANRVGTQIGRQGTLLLTKD